MHVSRGLTIMALTLLAFAPQILPGEPQELPATPTFKTGTKLVEVDVVAREKGRPAAGLTKDDFVLFDNGRPQAISLFSVNSASTPMQATPPLAPGAVSNRVDQNGVASATTTVILLDHLSTYVEDQLYAIHEISQFIDQRRPQDRVAIYAVGSKLTVATDLTVNADLLHRAVKNLKPAHVDGVTPQVSDVFAAGSGGAERIATAIRISVTNTKHAMESIARHLAAVPGRKSLVWITDGFPLALSDIPGLRSYSDSFTDQIQHAARALSEANIAVYPVDAHGVAGGLKNSGIDTMNLLAGLTGGEARYIDNGIDKLVGEAIEDGRIVYSLGFYPSDDAHDGQWHKLEVKSAKPGVNLRYRSSYFAIPEASGEIHRPTPEDLASDSLDATEIGLIAQAIPDKARPGLFNLRIVVDLHDLRLQNEAKSWVGGIELSIHLEGSDKIGKISKNVSVPEDKLEASLANGIVIEAPFDAGKKDGVLQVVVQDRATEAAGSLRVPLTRK